LHETALLEANVDEALAQRNNGNPDGEPRVTRPSRRMVFEALYRAHYVRAHAQQPDALERAPNDEYAQSGAQIAWEIWQAAHEHAIEVAAQLCESRQAQHISQDGKAVCRLCASDIRALLAATEKEDL